MNAICVTCGTQFGATSQVPESCPICEDERQYLGLDGQRWTTLPAVSQNHTIEIEEEEHGLSSFSIMPKFGIGQRAFLIQTSSGNVLWDCLSLLNETAFQYVQKLGGIAAIAISHPHYYTSMVEWSKKFENAPIYLHRDDAEWVMRPDERIQFWDGEAQPLPGGLTLIRCGGHFAGACVLHWPAGGDSRGALLTGDTVQVVPDRRWVSFMYSYPNYIPLNAATLKRIELALQPFAFEVIYGAFPKMTVREKGKQVVAQSIERYLKAIGYASS